MKCAHCVHSEGRLTGLWCRLRGAMAIQVCRHWQRATGSDDE